MAITSADAEVLLSADIFPIPMRLEEWATDDAWSMDSTELAEAHMGVDAHIAFGYKPTPKIITFNFMADSISLIEVIDPLIAHMDSRTTILDLSLILSLNSLGRSWRLWNGAMTSADRLPPGGTVLGKRSATFTFGKCFPILKA